ncbi:MAG: DUF58 domain-containing protein [Chloroflexota bacterium]
MARVAPQSDPALTLSADLLARIHAIEIRTRRLTASLLGGEYRSVFRGAGIEFAEAREYVDGDDVRMIDWNVTARMGTPWVKQFVEERDLSVMCVVDRSASTRVGTPERGRFGAAAELVALLAFAATQNGDRAGLLTFSDAPDVYLKPERGTRHALRLVRDVLAAEPAFGRRTKIADAVDYLGRVLRRRSVVFVISDFLDAGYEEALRGLARRHEVVALVLVDPVDGAIPNMGMVAVADAETGERMWVDTGDARVRERYAEAAAARAEARRRAIASCGVEEITIPISGDVIAPLAAYFRRRAQSR